MLVLIWHAEGLGSPRVLAVPVPIPPRHKCSPVKIPSRPDHRIAGKVFAGVGHAMRDQIAKIISPCRAAPPVPAGLKDGCATL